MNADSEIGVVQRADESPTPRSARARMSAKRQQGVCGPSFTGRGNRPVLTPHHHVERETGK